MLRTELLDARLVLAVTIASFNLTEGTITFLGDQGGTVEDELTLGVVNGLLSHNATIGTYQDSTDVDPGPGVAHFNLSAAVQISVFVGSANDSVSLNGLTVDTLVDLGGGDDILEASAVTAASVVAFGGEGDDILTGAKADTPFGDRLEGGDGEDILIGFAGDDRLFGDDGRDQLFGDAGNDVLEGGAGQDVISMGTGIDEVDGGEGSDFLTFEAPAGMITVSSFGANVFVNAASDGSSTGFFGAADVETLVITQTTAGPSALDLGDLVGTTVRQIDATDFESSDSVTVHGSGTADIITLALEDTLGNSKIPSAVLPWGRVGLSSSLSHAIAIGEGGDDRIAVEDGFPMGIVLDLRGGDGNDTLIGGSGDDTYNGGNGDDTLVDSPGADTFNGDAGFDTVLVQGTPGKDVITLNQTAAATFVVNFNAAVNTNTVGTVEAVRVDAGDGDDVIAVNVVDALILPSGIPGVADVDLGSLPVRVDGGGPHGSDRLVVRDDGTGDLVIHRQGADDRNGSITVGPLQPVDYEGIEFVDVTPLNTATGRTGTAADGQLVVFPADRRESNGSLLVATPLGGAPTFIPGSTIDPGPTTLPAPFGAIGGDEDWFEFRPPKIGTFRFTTLFRQIATLPSGRQGLPNNGDLDIEVYNAAGTLITSSNGILDNESVNVSMAADTAYYLRVFGFGKAINVYNLNVTEVDLLGPQVTKVFITSSPTYQLFDPKPVTDGPTPAIRNVTVRVRDLPSRAPGDLYPALNLDVAASPGLYSLVGDHTGRIPVATVTPVNNPAATGLVPTANIVLGFTDPLPDDRYTLTIFDGLTDPAGNRLDGESNASEPQSLPKFPSGNGVSGGNFVARFTVDSRPEIAAYSGNTVVADINGNFLYDPQNVDSTNRDLTFQFGELSDHRFAGKFGPASALGTRFDVLAAYGNVGGTYRFLIDSNGNGAFNPGVDLMQPSLPISGLAVAGNFDMNAANGDEVGVFDGTRWYLDTNRSFRIDAGDATVFDQLQGYPIVGDFDGDGNDDLATYRNDTFFFDLAFNGFTGLDGLLSFGAPGVLDRPLAADLNLDGIDDLGVWVPSSAVATGDAEWRFLISNLPSVAGSIAALTHPFNPVPLGSDLTVRYGDPRALPLIGNFDPPVTPRPTSTTTTVVVADDTAISGSASSATINGSKSAVTNASPATGVLPTSGAAAVVAVLPTSRHFDFDASAGHTAPDYVSVLGSDTFTAARAFGWNGAVIPTTESNGANLLLCDGHTGSNRQFRVQLPNGDYSVNVTLGDPTQLRELVDVWAEGQARVDDVTTRAGEFATREFAVTVSDGELNLQFIGGGTTARFTLNALDICPVSGLTTVALTAGMNAPADGNSSIQITGNTTLPNDTTPAVTSNLGTIITRDLDSSLTISGSKSAVANASTPATILPNAGDAPVGAVLPTSRHFDFDASAGHTAPDYVSVLGSDTFTAARAFGWNGAVIPTTEGMSIGANLLLCDGHTGSNRQFRVQLPNGDYAVNVTLGDPTQLRELVDVWAEGQARVDDVTTLAGQFTTRAFAVTVNDGELNLQFIGGGTMARFTLDALDIRPVSNLATVTFAAATSAPADGNSSIEVAGNTTLANGTFLTVTSSLGNITSLDLDSSVLGTQILVTNGQFSVRLSSLSAGDAMISIEEPTGRILPITRIAQFTAIPPAKTSQTVIRPSNSGVVSPNTYLASVDGSFGQSGIG